MRVPSRAWRLSEVLDRCPGDRGSTAVFEVVVSILREGTAFVGTALPIVSTGASGPTPRATFRWRRPRRRRWKRGGPILVGWATTPHALECRRTRRRAATTRTTRHQWLPTCPLGRDPAVHRTIGRGTPGRVLRERRTRGPTDGRRMRSRSTRSMGVAGAHYIPRDRNTASTAREARGATRLEVLEDATSPRRRRGRPEK
jgi:hypothetical protein